MLGRIHNLFIERWPKFFWRWRHLIDPHWADAYCSNAAILHPHRRILSDTVKAFEPKSIFEYGCASGANLLWFTIDNPEASVYGYDLSKKATKKAKEFLSGYKNVAIYESDDEWDSRMYDVIITDATLIYFSTNEVYDILKKFQKVCSKAIVLCEWDRLGHSVLHSSHWIHDYQMMLGPSSVTRISLSDIWPSGGWKEFGYIITWVKEQI